MWYVRASLEWLCGMLELAMWYVRASLEWLCDMLELVWSAYVIC